MPVTSSKPCPDVFNPLKDDFARFETEIYAQHQLSAEEEVINKTQLALRSLPFFAALKAAAAIAGYRFVGYRWIGIRLRSGTSYRVHSPAFVKAKPKDKRRRRRRQNVLTHLGLEYLGFCRKCSPGFVACVAQQAALCPSFDVASTVLGKLGITANTQLVRRLSYDAIDRLWNQGQIPQIVVDDAYRKPGIRVQICIDGARVRERRNFKGRKRKGKKYRRYYADWFEPRMFSIVLVDDRGKILRKIDGERVRPIYDGRSEPGLAATFELLASYLAEINLAEAASISFCADGGNGLWPGINRLIASLGLPVEKVATIEQVLDHAHAKQNLKQLVEKIRDGGGIHFYQFADTLATFEKWLWAGNTGSMRDFIQTSMKRKRGKKAALKKLEEYFGDGRRMRYAEFRKAGIPIGSGSIESAIRRVINLRIKSPGTFWKRDNVERMIFLRCQVIVGRWETLWRRHCEAMRKCLHNGDFHVLQKAA